MSNKGVYISTEPLINPTIKTELTPFLEKQDQIINLDLAKVYYEFKPTNYDKYDLSYQQDLDDIFVINIGKPGNIRIRGLININFISKVTVNSESNIVWLYNKFNFKRKKDSFEELLNKERFVNKYEIILYAKVRDMVKIIEFIPSLGNAYLAKMDYLKDKDGDANYRFIYLTNDSFDLRYLLNFYKTILLINKKYKGKKLRKNNYEGTCSSKDKSFTDEEYNLLNILTGLNWNCIWEEWKLTDKTYYINQNNDFKGRPFLDFNDVYKQSLINVLNNLIYFSKHGWIFNSKINKPKWSRIQVINLNEPQLTKEKLLNRLQSLINKKYEDIVLAGEKTKIFLHIDYETKSIYTMIQAIFKNDVFKDIILLMSRTKRMNIIFVPYEDISAKPEIFLARVLQTIDQGIVGLDNHLKRFYVKLSGRLFALNRK